MTKLKKFFVRIPWHATAIYEIEAKNKKDALQKAFDQGHPSVCCHCSKNLEIDEHNDSVESEVVEYD